MKKHASAHNEASIAQADAAETPKQEATAEQSKPQAIEELAELKDTLQHLQAEFENYRKRSEKDQRRCQEHANRELLTALLPVLDSFDACLGHQDKHEEFIKGVALIRSQLTATLAKQGLERITVKNKPFDPYTSEVLLQQQGPSDVVLEELQPGYRYKEVVLRHAKVVVGKADSANAATHAQAPRS